MAGRRTNLGLSLLLGAAVLTGALMFAIGGGWNRWATVAHAVVGLAIVVLAPWKSVIARRGLARRRSGTWISAALSAVVTVAVLAGVAHAFGWVDLGALTVMQVHVGAGLIALPLAVAHLVARPQRFRRTDFSRRQLLKGAAVLGGGAAVVLGSEGAMRVLGLDGAERRGTGSFERGSFDPVAMPVTQWLDDRVRSIDRSTWHLSTAPREWSWEEIDAFDDELEATLDCTGGWYSVQRWGGARLDRLLPTDGSASILIVSATGYRRRFPASDASSMLVATRVGGRPLSAGHGSPARLVAPGRRGFWWVKWVERIETSDIPWWRQWPFPPT